MAVLSKLWSSVWFYNNSSAPTQALVNARDPILADNTSKIDKIAGLKDQLHTCFEAVKKANPTLIAQLKSSEEPMTDQEMSEQIKILALASLTDLDGLHHDLEEVRKKREQLEHLIGIWEKIEALYDTALENAGNAQTLDGKNIQDLTELREVVQNVGVSPTCHIDLIPL